MRWSQLFADLEGLMEADEARQFAIEVAERTRVERADVELAARLKAAEGTTIRAMLVGGAVVSGEVTEAAPQWLLVVDGVTEHLVPTASICVLSGVDVRSVPVTEVERRLSLGAALRALSRNRAHAVIATVSGEISGLIGAVYADHLDVIPARSREGARTAAAVPFHAIVEVRSTAL